jgi:hypothetical protein
MRGAFWFSPAGPSTQIDNAGPHRKKRHFLRGSAIHNPTQPEEPLDGLQLRGYSRRRVLEIEVHDRQFVVILFHEDWVNGGRCLAAVASQHLDLPIANANRSE